MPESQIPPHKTPVFKKLCNEVSRASHRFAMLAAGDRVLVGVSGGEDSLMLMHILSRLQQRTPFPFDLIPATVDLGFPGFDLDALARYCREQAWDLQIIRFEGAAMIRDKQLDEQPCSLCSRLRRGQLHALADRLNCNKIALGQHLDDLCVSFLMSLFRGGGLKTMGPHVDADQGSKRLIRPLCQCTKQHIKQAAAAFAFPSIKSCPYGTQLRENGDRHFLEQLLQQLDQGQFKNIRSAMLHSMGDVRLAHLLDQRFLNQNDPDSGKL